MSDQKIHINLYLNNFNDKSLRSFLAGSMEWTLDEYMIKLNGQPQILPHLIFGGQYLRLPNIP